MSDSVKQISMLDRLLPTLVGRLLWLVSLTLRVRLEGPDVLAEEVEAGLGYRPIRGSSSRGGARALLQLVREVRRTGGVVG